MGMCDGTKSCICDWCENTPTELEALRDEVERLKLENRKYKELLADVPGARGAGGAT